MKVKEKELMEKVMGKLSGRDIGAFHRVIQYADKEVTNIYRTNHVNFEFEISKTVDYPYRNKVEYSLLIKNRMDKPLFELYHDCDMASDDSFDKKLIDLHGNIERKYSEYVNENIAAQQELGLHELEVRCLESLDYGDSDNS